MNSYENTDVGALIVMCRKRDEEAFAELVNRYTPMMRKVISAFPLSGSDFGELFSEACVAFHSAVMSYDLGQSSVTFGLYARICVHHRIVDLLRTRDSEPKVSKCDVEAMSDADAIESDIVERETVDLLMKSARALLSDYEYRVLMLHIQGYKTAAIAEVLNRSAKSVDNAKARMFRRLREALGGISDI